MPGDSLAASRRYASAVFEIAESQDALDDWDADLALLATLFDDKTADWLANPRVPAADKNTLIDRGLASTSEQVRNLARLLVTRGRPALAGSIRNAYRAQVDERRGIVHATVTTAVPLADGDRASVAERLSGMTGRQVMMETTVDPSLIGGIVVRIGDKLIDGSTRARLLALKQRLKGAG